MLPGVRFTHLAISGWPSITFFVSYRWAFMSNSTPVFGGGPEPRKHERPPAWTPRFGEIGLERTAFTYKVTPNGICRAYAQMAIASISTRTSLGRRATSTVARAGGKARKIAHIPR